MGKLVVGGIEMKANLSALATLMRKGFYYIIDNSIKNHDNLLFENHLIVIHKLKQLTAII